MRSSGPRLSVVEMLAVKVCTVRIVETLGAVNIGCVVQ
jgi:hypothetical protein